MDCVECLYFDAIADRCVLRGECVYADDDDSLITSDDCDNCYFCVNGKCEKIGGCRYD